ncbi:hypothetical protein G6O67_007619 [Ophiocordyceps sinensis]|uniref:Sulfotransferase family protein n=1 Tax=Ophiocordyceps sinensis TaxID=72228 RepID=A0A8H4LUQ4_9HYPO|nr:hypothetical protein G6O67_007619 [Ophiocordyceps sinensis]
MTGSEWDSKPKRDLKVLVLGLPRTGTASMAEALTMLGYKDWDEVWGRSEAVTDLAGMFATQLIPLYPEAKVILTTRDFDKWKGSVEALFRQGWTPLANAARWVEPVLGSGVIVALRKALLGSFAAADADEACRNARVVYDGHHRRIRELAAPGQLLEYRAGQGWEPLCDFLDRPVPRADFPWLNDAESLARAVRCHLWRAVAAAAWRLVPLVVAVVALGGYRIVSDSLPR